VRWNFLELGLNAQNVLNAQYPLSEFFYASSFTAPSSPPSPPFATLAPTEEFTAAPPRTVLLTLSFLLDRESDR
jgi:outer membrane receptor protein involved in Fe transport